MDNNTTITTNTVTSLKFKLPKKIFSDSNACVPRKLRSAIRKRSYEIGSACFPDAKRSNTQQNGWSDHSPRRSVSFEISKDEEEVAETLFALAGMIPLEAIHKEYKTSYESFEAKSPELSKIQYSNPTPSSKDAVTRKDESETAILLPNSLSERRQANLNVEVPVPPVPFQIPPLFRACDDKKLSNATSFFGSTEHNQENMLNESKPEIFQLHKREFHNNIGVADLAAKHDKNNASTSELLHDSGVDRHSWRSSGVNYPSWLNNSSLSITGSFKDDLSASKVSCSINGVRKSWKRCIAHVCICRLIQGLQTSEGKDIQPSDASQMRSSQCPAAENKVEGMTTFAAGHMFDPGTRKIEKCHVEEEGSSISGFCDSKKQSYNFLSLSTGGAINNCASRLSMNLEAKDHVLQLHSVGQNDTYVPCSTPHHRFLSLPYRDQATFVSVTPPSMMPQVKLQVPPYFGSPCSLANIEATTRSSQQPHSKQQQIWTAQLAAQFRPGPFLSSQIANWKNSTRETHTMNHNQAPCPSQEMMGAKYLQISQQPQQQLLGLCQSLPSMSSSNLQNG